MGPAGGAIAIGRRSLAGLFLAFGAAAPAMADEQVMVEGRCPDAPLRVSYTHAADLRRACDAWRRVADFLVVERGLRVAAPIDLVFVDRVELDLGPEKLRVLGHYDRTRRLARITSSSAGWLREPDRLMFGLPVDGELHTSLIVHELSHAVLLDNYRVAVPGRVCGEYVAYVVQLATMQQATREQVLSAYGPGDFGTLEEITEVCHLLNPHEFGVRAWRHFAREGHAYILDLILSGRVGVDLPP